MTPEVNEKFSKIAKLVQCITPFLQVMSKEELEEIIVTLKPWADGNLLLQARNEMETKDLVTMEKVLTHAIEVINKIIDLQTLLIKEPVNQNAASSKVVQ